MGWHRGLRTQFSTGAESYDHARRGYPEELIRNVILYSAVSPQDLVLDIGCGTAKSTIPLAQAGLRIVALDISRDILALARRNSVDYPSIKFVLGEFEHVAFSPGSFKLLTAGTSFHWLDPTIAYRKSADNLAFGGSLAVFHGFDCYESSGLSTLEDLYRSRCPNYPLDLRESWKKVSVRMHESGFFGVHMVKKYRAAETFTHDQLRSLANSYSWVRSLSDEERVQFNADLGNLLDAQPSPIELLREYVLVIGRKTR